MVQALRYLAEYRIAHLDLKPTNIMTNRRLNLKLIDFGESYHPEVAGKSLNIQIISQDSRCLTVLLKIIKVLKATTIKTMFFLWAS